MFSEVEGDRLSISLWTVGAMKGRLKLLVALMAFWAYAAAPVHMW